MKRKLYIGFIIIVMLVPFVFTFICPTTITYENRDLTQFPSLVTDSGLNIDYLSELGDYFEDHFAFRNEMVGINAHLHSLIDSSSQESVILGSDDWLYFKNTIDDYQGTNTLSDRSLYNIAHNLFLMQGMCEAMGSEFYYVVSPNKNTLYSENMPYYYVEGEQGNLDLLIPYLEKEGVNYIDLQSAFEKEDEVLYLKTDSHWNNKGAVLAYNTILDALDVEHDDLSNTDYEIRKDYVGDLDKMLYASYPILEEQYYYDIDQNYEVTSSSDDVESDIISAHNETGEGNLVMYRDSFGNTLFPLMANVFEDTYYSKLSPYSLSDVSSLKPDYVIVERVERRISSIIEEVPVMQGPTLSLHGYETKETNSTISTKVDGDYTIISGIIDSSVLDTESQIYVSVDSDSKIAYEAFGCLKDDADNGYQVYILNKNIPKDATISVYVLTNGQLTQVARKD